MRHLLPAFSAWIATWVGLVMLPLFLFNLLIGTLAATIATVCGFMINCLLNLCVQAFHGSWHKMFETRYAASHPNSETSAVVVPPTEAEQEIALLYSMLEEEAQPSLVAA